MLILTIKTVMLLDGKVTKSMTDSKLTKCLPCLCDVFQ